MEDFKEISRETLAKKIADREENLTILDVRPVADYRQAHLPQAINVPLDEIELLVPPLVHNQYEDLVLYSGSATCNLSEQAARMLVRLGYKNVKRYVGGLGDWLDADLPIERDVEDRAA